MSTLATKRRLTGVETFNHSVADRYSGDEVARSQVTKLRAEKSERLVAAPPRAIGARVEGKTPASMKHIRKTLIFQRQTGERVSPTTLHRMTVTQMERRGSQFRERAQGWTTSVRARRQARELLFAVVLV
ncbi:hypothetical protein SFRURICE_012413 [Spodoptera frugiperda]|nr:hypothetical protein SFRURICE_012413 [Spodoptera frugiperda]